MKTKYKNLAAAIMMSGLFFVPVFCSAQTTGSFNHDNNNLPKLNDNISQAEVEAEEAILLLEKIYYSQFSTARKNNNNIRTRQYDILFPVFETLMDTRNGGTFNLHGIDYSDKDIQLQEETNFYNWANKF